jgi:hypothetical protein
VGGLNYPCLYFRFNSFKFRWQENYSVDDSVLNIAFGTIAGGVFGAAGSAFSRVKPPKLETIKPEVEARIIKTVISSIIRISGFIVIGLRRFASLSVFSLTSLSLGVSSSTFLDFSTLVLCLPEYNELPGILKRQINNREFLKRDPEAQNIVNTLDDRPDEFKTTPPMKEVKVETVEKTELGAEDIPFLRELSDANLSL